MAPMTNTTSKREPRPRQLTAYYIRATGEYGFVRRGHDSTAPVEARRSPEGEGEDREN